jgi:hypothetical protein
MKGKSLPPGVSGLRSSRLSVTLSEARAGEHARKGYEVVFITSLKETVTLSRDFQTEIHHSSLRCVA